MAAITTPDWAAMARTEQAQSEDMARLIAEIRQIKTVLSRSAGALLHEFGRLDADGRPVFHHAVAGEVARELAGAHQVALGLLVEHAGTDV